MAIMPMITKNIVTASTAEKTLEKEYRFIFFKADEFKKNCLVYILKIIQAI